MRNTFVVIVSILILTAVNAQSPLMTDEFSHIPNAEYAIVTYDSAIKATVLSYHYHDLWDIDNDGIKDVISFVGNGAAHTYYQFQVRLSSSDTWYIYPTFQLDMPYYQGNKNIKELKESHPQFLVSDFDHDQVDEIYLNLENPFGSIPEELTAKGVLSKRILIEFENEKLIIRDFNG
ncbi:hypothetical protein GCM10022393_10310 [Aquimarina addita]|uniref:VCBS repeat-containing protein n=1 Tax=Aquimarina addita TaxID=870485 RepID=A0ABP7XED5_9FLAO